MRRLWAGLPGPTALKTLEVGVLVVALLVALALLFEWAGAILDSGGTVGA